MPIKILLIVLILKLVFLPFVIWNSVVRLFGFGPKDRYWVRLFRKSGDVTEFVTAMDCGGQLLEQRGIVGERAERIYLDPDQIDALKSRIEDLRAQGFAEMDDDDCVWLDLASPTKDEWPTKAELGLRNELWDDLDAFLADTGLGAVTGCSAGSGSVELELKVVDETLAREAILNFVKGTKFAAFDRFNTFEAEAA